MLRMLRFLVQLLGFGDPYAEAKRRARLTEEQALAIALKVDAPRQDGVGLYFATLVEEGGEQIWRFSSTTVGSGWTLKIRDRDGLFVGRDRWGVR
jgi:hypothetical protein